MEFGASIFFTDYSITPAELAVALEERGFDSVWAAEHSHIPVPRKTPAPGGGELHKRYYDVMDPFVTLTAAACALRLRLSANFSRLTLMDNSTLISGRLGQYFLLKDHLAGVVDNAYRCFLHRHIKGSVVGLRQTMNRLAA